MGNATSYIAQTVRGSRSRTRATSSEVKVEETPSTSNANECPTTCGSSNESVAMDRNVDQATASSGSTRKRRRKSSPSGRRAKKRKKGNKQCSTCGTKFKKKIQFERHMQNYSAPRTHICRKCNIKFPQQFMLFTHNLSTHNKSTIRYDPEYTCNFCKQKFIDKTHVQVHLFHFHADLVNSIQRQEPTASNNSNRAHELSEFSDVSVSRYENVDMREFDESHDDSQNETKSVMSNQSLDDSLSRRMRQTKVTDFFAKNAGNESADSGQLNASSHSRGAKSRESFNRRSSSSRGNSSKTIQALSDADLCKKYNCEPCKVFVKKVDHLVKQRSQEKKEKVEETAAKPKVSVEPKSMICDRCNHEFSKLNGLRTHRNSCKPTVDCNVVNCNLRFNNHTVLNKHLKYEHGPEKYHAYPYHCKICKNFFASDFHQMKSHKLKSHYDKSDDEVMGTKSDETINNNKGNAEIENRGKDGEEAAEQEPPVLEESCGSKSAAEQLVVPLTNDGNIGAAEENNNDHEEVSSCHDNGAFDQPESEFEGEAASNSMEITEEVPTLAEKSAQPTNLFVCKTCKSSYKTHVRYKEHKQNYAQNPRFKCSVCFVMFANAARLARHKKIAHVFAKSGKNLQRCKICNEGFKCKKFYLEHMRHYHSRNIQGELPSYTCQTCGITFNTAADCAAHKLRYMKKRDFKCDVCQHMFLSQVRVDKHKKIAHEDQSTDQQLRCTRCNHPFTTKRKLEMHTKHEHPAENPEPEEESPAKDNNKVKRLLTCPKCNMRLKSVNHKKLHVKKCRGAKSKGNKVAKLTSASLNSTESSAKEDNALGKRATRNRRSIKMTEDEIQLELSKSSLDDSSHSSGSEDKGASSVINARAKVGENKSTRSVYEDESSSQELFNAGPTHEFDDEGGSDCEVASNSETMHRSLPNKREEGRESSGKTTNNRSCNQSASYKESSGDEFNSLADREIPTCSNLDQRCNICKRNFVRKTNYCEHVNRYSNKGKHKCHKCCRNFKTLDLLDQHNKQHDPKTAYLYKVKCPHCPERFFRNDSLQMHLTHMHQGESEESAAKESTTEAVTSKSIKVIDRIVLSSTESNNDSSLSEVETESSDFARTSKRATKKSYHTSSSRNDRITRQPRDSVSSDASRKSVGDFLEPAVKPPPSSSRAAKTASKNSSSSACKSTSILDFFKSTPRLPDYLSQMKIDTDDAMSVASSTATRDLDNYEPYKCKTCNLTFISGKSYKKHCSFYQNSGDYLCDVCGRSFPSPDAFNSHRRSHEDESYQYNCSLSECNEKFLTEELAASHRAHVHSDCQSTSDVASSKDAPEQTKPKAKRAPVIVHRVSIGFSKRKPDSYGAQRDLMSEYLIKKEALAETVEKEQDENATPPIDEAKKLGKQTKYSPAYTENLDKFERMLESIRNDKTCSWGWMVDTSPLKNATLKASNNRMGNSPSKFCTPLKLKNVVAAAAENLQTKRACKNLNENDEFKQDVAISKGTNKRDNCSSDTEIIAPGEPGKILKKRRLEGGSLNIIPQTSVSSAQENNHKILLATAFTEAPTNVLAADDTLTTISDIAEKMSPLPHNFNEVEAENGRALKELFEIDEKTNISMECMSEMSNKDVTKDCITSCGYDSDKESEFLRNSLKGSRDMVSGNFVDYIDDDEGAAIPVYNQVNNEPEDSWMPSTNEHGEPLIDMQEEVVSHPGPLGAPAVTSLAKDCLDLAKVDECQVSSCSSTQQNIASDLECHREENKKRKDELMQNKFHRNCLFFNCHVATFTEADYARHKKSKCWRNGCFVCNETFEDQESLTMHMLEYYNCDKCFKSLNVLKRYYENKSMQGSNKSDSERYCENKSMQSSADGKGDLSS